MNFNIKKCVGIPRYKFNDLFSEMNVKFIGYSNGLLLVKTKKYWFLDMKSEKIFGPFNEANLFNNNLARIVDLENNVKFLKKDGTFVKNNMNTNSVRNYNSNKLISKEKKLFYIYDTNGRLINKVDAENVKDYSGAYAVAQFNDEKGLYFKYLNSFGNVSNMKRYEELYDFNEGFAIGKPFQEYKSCNSIIYHIFDNELNIISKFKAASIIGNKFIYGLCIVTNWDKDNLLKFGFINSNGEYQIPCNYDMVYNFSDGLARIKLNDKYGFIDKNNNLVIHNMLDEASDFINGLSAVKYNGLWHIINKAGEFILFEYPEKPTIIDDLIVFEDNTYLPISDLNKIYKVKISNENEFIECNFESIEKRDKFFDDQVYKLNKTLNHIKKFEQDSSRELFLQMKRSIKTKNLIKK